MPNSLNSRPVEPLRNASGVNTATSEMVVAITAKAISRVPLMAAVSGSLAQLLLVPVGVLQHDDRVVHHDADGEREGEQGEVVDREAEEVHDREGRDDGRRDREARDDRRPQVPQEDEDDDHDQAARRGSASPPPPGSSASRRSTGRRRRRGCTPGGSDAWIRGSSARIASATCDDVRLGLPDDADGDGGRALEAEGAALVLGAQLDPAEILELDQHAARRC